MVGAMMTKDEALTRCAQIRERNIPDRTGYRQEFENGRLKRVIEVDGAMREEVTYERA